MAEGQTCYAQDERFCEDQMCLRTGCRLQNKITITPADEAFFAACQEMKVEPTHTVAARIAAKYGYEWTHPLVDDIAHALEDAMEMGRVLGPLEQARSHPDLKASPQPTVTD